MSIRQGAARAAFFLALAPALVPALAQQSSSLTLAEVLRAARDNSEVAIARQSLAAARADILAADHAPAMCFRARPTASLRINRPTIQDCCGDSPRLTTRRRASPSKGFWAGVRSQGES